MVNKIDISKNIWIGVVVLVVKNSNVSNILEAFKIGTFAKQCMRLHHSPDASTFPRFKQMRFVEIIYF